MQDGGVVTVALRSRDACKTSIAAPAFDILFIGCVLNIEIVYTTAEKLTFEAFY